MRKSPVSAPSGISKTRHIRAAKAQVARDRQKAHNLLAIQRVHQAAVKAEVAR